MRSEIESEIRKIVTKLYGIETIPAFSVESPENEAHGDYATNIALSLSKAVKRSPSDIAKEIAAKISNNRFEKVAVVSPGFINVFLKDDFLISQMTNVGADWGKSDVGKGRTVIVEYFQLNIAKRPHVGHLRSAVIGDSIKRMLLSQGYNAISDTHIGDWGTQFGIIIYAVKQVSPTVRDMIESDPLVQYEVLYNLYNSAIKDPSIRTNLQREEWANQHTDFDNLIARAKEEFSKLESGDTENRSIWQKAVDVSMQELNRTAEQLRLEKFNEHKGESSYGGDMPRIVSEALERGVAKKKDDGAVVVDLTHENLDEAILAKSDGASTYLLRDLATIKYRKEHWKFSQNLYVVDVRQSHHFRQLFRVAELFGFEGVGESKHIEFGFMSLPGGAMSTRKGNVINLGGLIQQAGFKAAQVIREKNPALYESSNLGEIRDAIALGAIKYFDLSHHRKSDIVFRWESALTFEGNTGPYLQYTHARLKSILRKAGDKSSAASFITLTPIEHSLLVTILRFPEVIEDTLKDYTPNTLANYLYILAGRVNEFYHSHPVIQETHVGKQAFRLKLVEAASQTIKNGLRLLGIDAPEEM